MRLTGGEPAKLVVRAKKLRLQPAGSPPAADALAVLAVIETVGYQGQAARSFVRVGDRQLQAVNMIDEHPFAEGETVSVHLRGRDCATLSADA